MSGKVAFCVVAWNNASVLPLCLDSLLAQTGVEFDIYLIDNASTDDTHATMANYPTVLTAWSDRNNGFARGNNLLIAQALKDPAVEYLALVNSDAVLSPDWASTLVGFAEQHAITGSLQGLTLDYFNHKTVDSQHIFVNTYLQGVQYGWGDPVDPETYYPRKVFGVNAAAAIYTRAMIEALPDQQNNFFDERFYMYYEDVDVAFRALLTGWDAWFVPAAVAYHMGSVSAKQLGSSYSASMTARNLPAMAFKNVPWRILRANFGNAKLQMKLFLEDVGKRLGPAAERQARSALLRGLLRLPIYAASRRRVLGARVIGDDYLVRILRRDGILG